MIHSGVLHIPDNPFVLLGRMPTLVYGPMGYIILQHFAENIFNTSMAYITANPKNASDIFAAYDDMLGVTAEFVEGEGFGAFGGIWGGVENTRGGESVEERAEIWYERV